MLWQKAIHSAHFRRRIQTTYFGNLEETLSHLARTDKIQGIWIEIKYSPAPEKLEKMLTFLRSRRFFPRASLLSNMNIYVSKLFVIQISFPTTNDRRVLR